MLEQVAKKITAHMVEEGIVPAEDAEIYEYGWAISISQIGSLLLMVSIGALAGQFIGTLIFMLATFPLRSFAGGFHADTYFKCFLLSMGGYIVTLLLAVFWPANFQNWALALLAFSFLATFRYAPITHPNKAHLKKKIGRDKVISRVVVSSQTVVIVGLWFLLPAARHILLWAMLGMAMTSVSLLYSAIRPYGIKPVL